MIPSEKIVKLYDKIYGIYRLYNFIITFGMDEFWRKKAAKLISSYFKNKKSLKILDCACGCGDMTKHLKDFFPESDIYGIDGNSKMLEIAERRVFGVKFINSFCSKLPFPDNYFDAVVVSFATRNLYYSNESSRIFDEIKRVIKEDGFFFSIETNLPQNKILRILFKVYMELIFFLILFFLKDEDKGPYLFLKRTVLKFNSKELIISLSDLKVRKINIFFDVIHMLVFTKNDL